MAQDQQTTAGLRWGVKTSFRNYVEGAGGSIEASGGAERTTDGAFAFEPAPGAGLRLNASGKPEGRAMFTGEVRFAAHGGMLQVCLADPQVEIGPDGAVISVMDSPMRDRRVVVAKLNMAGAERGGDGAWVFPASITIEGYQVLGDHYPPGTALDPVVVRVSR